MGLTEKSQLLEQISPPTDPFLAGQLVDEFVSLETRYIQRDWGPAELDGGQFCEALARILYHIDSGNLNRTKGVDDCAKYVENDRNPHSMLPRHDALHMFKVLSLVYKFRSQRGAVHITPSYSPNQMDSRVIIENVRWSFAELLRILSQKDREIIAKSIRELLQFDVPIIGKFEDVLLVQRTDLKPEEEILILLHYAGENGFSRTELGQHSILRPPDVSKAIYKLVSSKFRQVVKVDKRYRLTDLGSKRLREELSEKLLLQ